MENKKDITAGVWMICLLLVSFIFAVYYFSGVPTKKVDVKREEKFREILKDFEKTKSIVIKNQTEDEWTIYKEITTEENIQEFLNEFSNFYIPEFVFNTVDGPDFKVEMLDENGTLIGGFDNPYIYNDEYKVGILTDDYNKY